ncbi:MAG: glutathione S-transferase family protein [Pseudorhodobacter sp.]|nr:glutathione S-transferase family protein [Pseudorhodobacter sp.]
MITLYGVSRSRATRPLWALQETGMEFKQVPVLQAYRLTGANAAWSGLTTSSPEFLAINPLGQVPALADGDVVLTESLAITLYIARKSGGPLGPATDLETAQMEQWALFAATSVEIPALEVYYPLAEGRADTREGAALIAIGAEKLRRPLKRLQAWLSTHDYLVGDRFTAADINTAECIRYAQGHPTLLAEFPAVDAWLHRCQSRPAFQTMWAARDLESA